MSGKVANYSGALQIGDSVRLVAIPGDYPYLEIAKTLFHRPATVCKKIMSAPPYCTIWYYLDFGTGIPALPVTRDMIR